MMGTYRICQSELSYYKEFDFSVQEKHMSNLKHNNGSILFSCTSKPGFKALALEHKWSHYYCNYISCTCVWRSNYPVWEKPVEQLQFCLLKRIDQLLRKKCKYSRQVVKSSHVWLFKESCQSVNQSCFLSKS